MTEGHEGHEMFFIGSGSVRVFKASADPDGDALELATLHAGHFFGEMALVAPQNSVRMASIAAVSFCDLFVLSFDDFERLAQNYASIRSQIKAQAERRRAETREIMHSTVDEADSEDGEEEGEDDERTLDSEASDPDEDDEPDDGRHESKQRPQARGFLSSVKLGRSPNNYKAATTPRGGRRDGPLSPLHPKPF